MTSPFDPELQEKILTAQVRRIMDALRNAGGEARVVGGAVRDALMGRKIGDIDLAATLPPEKTMEILAAQKIKTVPTGLAHGTLTAVLDHTGYEITTLRRDVATDGRHAEVAYTDDWQTDAARRDFTFNALYLDAQGNLYDYFGGAQDAQDGRVRFIGDAGARIREDVLRILRFFRFYAWFGRGEPDAAALAACGALANLMPRLSAERVARETLKLLAAENPLPAWKLMLDAKVTQHFLAEAANLDALQKLLACEKQFNELQAPLTRLAALLPHDEKTAAAIAARLKLPNREGEKLRALAELPGLLRGKLDPVPLRRLLYAHGAENCRATLFLLGENITAPLATVAAWENPVFPLKGEDVVKLGIPAGPRVGEILREAEQGWIESDFRANRAACLAQAKVAGKAMGTQCS